MNECIAEPEVCPACNELWNASGQCARCGLLYNEAMGLIRLGCAAFAQAREAALVGRFAEARECLARVRACGMPAVFQHPAVERLTELCAAASGDTGAQTRITAGEERAARSAVARADFRAAAFYAGRAVAAAPGALPLQKLYLLTLYGAGRMTEAAQLRQELRRVAPADADLIRWRMSELDEIDRMPLPQTGASGSARNSVLAVAAGCVVGAALLLLTGNGAGRKEEKAGVK